MDDLIQRARAGDRDALDQLLRETLDQAEEHMLALYAERAQLADGQHILELGCGWGSLCLYNAERFPNAQITAISNSRTQKEHIDTEARKRGLKNLRIITCDINAFDIAPAQFDRVMAELHARRLAGVRP